MSLHKKSLKLFKKNLIEILYHNAVKSLNILYVFKKRFIKIIDIGVIFFYLWINLSTTFAQRQGNTWYFGDSAGIDFNHSTYPPYPDSLTDSKMSAGEGCATISDKDGNLLFYTNGVNIWDCSHSFMPNASGTDTLTDWDIMLSGDPSASQSGIVTPVLGNPDLYYVFTVDGWTSCGGVGICAGPKKKYDGLYYSLVNMKLNNGRGDIDTAFIHNLGFPGNKIPLIDSTAEKITAAIHANGSDYWIITRRQFESVYYAYLVSSGVVSLTPVKSVIGNLGSGRGYLRASFDGKVIVNAEGNNYVELLYFNNNTGSIDSFKQVSTNNTGDKYGVAFSPNDSIIYILQVEAPPILYRYLRYAPNPSATEQMLLVPGSIHGGAIQLGPDGNIYMANAGFSNLIIITNPDDFSVGITLDKVGIKRTSAEGLPFFFDHYVFQQGNITDYAISDSTLCKGDSIYIGQDSTFSYTFNWSPSLYMDDSTSSNPLVKPDTTTTYVVVINKVCTSIYDTVTIQINDSIFIDLGGDRDICYGSSTELIAGIDTSINYTWSTGAEAPYIIVDSAGIYWVQASKENQCPTGQDTIQVTVTPLPIADILIKDTSICRDDSIQLMITGGTSYSWLPDSGLSNNSIANPISKPKLDITYTAIVYDSCGSDTAILSLTILDCSYILEVPSAFTPNRDGTNDILLAYHKGIMHLLDFKIYNRWGEVIFQTKNINEGWNGYYNGKEQETGLYIYTLDAITYNQNIIKMEGGIILIK